MLHSPTHATRPHISRRSAPRGLILTYAILLVKVVYFASFFTSGAKAKRLLKKLVSSQVSIAESCVIQGVLTTGDIHSSTIQFGCILMAVPCDGGRGSEGFLLDLLREYVNTDISFLQSEALINFVITLTMVIGT